MNKGKRLDKGQLFVTGIFAVIMLFLFWRCFYSVNYGDEPYCISSVWRFYKGDALLAQDWFPAQQLIAWILSPFVYLFRIFWDSNDGIILASRLLYVAFQGVVSVIVYVRLKEFPICRVPAVMIYLLATQNNMLTINYNTLGIGCMVLILTILITEKVYSKAVLALVGILSAVMILSQPYAILMFFVWAVAVFVALPFSKNKNIHPLLKFRNFFFVGVGAFAVLVVFIAVVLSRAGISEVRNGFHYLMNDPEHQMDLKYKVSKYFERFYRYYKYQILVTGACLVVGFLKDSRIVRFMKIDCFLLAAAAAIGALVEHGWLSDYVPIDFICVPLTFLGISIWFLGKKKNCKLFFVWMVPALLYTFCVQLTTNTGILAVTSACIVASVGAVLLVGEVLGEAKKELGQSVYQMLLILLIAILTLQGVLMMYHRMTATWWSDPVSECTVLLREGPAKGIYTSPEDAESYNQALKNIELLQLDEKDQVLFLELDPMMYLYADLPVASYSTWTIEEKNFLQEYYEAYPEKEPTVVCWSEAKSEEEAVGMQYFLDKGYERIETNEVVALRKNK